MGKEFPNYPGDVQDGDEPSFSPNKTHKSILGTERGTHYTRRIETDASGNIYVTNATGLPESVQNLAVGAVTNVTDSTLTTITTYTAIQETKVTRIVCSGTDYAKFQLFLNTVLIETKRSGPERSIEFLFNSPLLLNIADVLDVKVTHYNTSILSNFESTIYGA